MGVVALLGGVNPHNETASGEQTITVEGAPAGGSFTLSFKGETSAPIAFDAPAQGAGSVQAALEAISAEVEVSGPAGGPYMVFFTGAATDKAEPPIEASGAGLTPAGAVGVVSDYPGGTTDTHYHFEYVAQKQFEAKGSPGEFHAGSGCGLREQQSVGLICRPVCRRGKRTVTGSSRGVPRRARRSWKVLKRLDGAGRAVRGWVVGCPNEVFRTGLSAHLPDCRAYEQVTPVEKDGAQEPLITVCRGLRGRRR